MKVQEEFDIKWESINYLEEHVTDTIWNLLDNIEDSIPKNTKVKVTIEFL